MRYKRSIDNNTFSRKLTSNGDSITLAIPPRFLKFLGARKGTILCILCQKKKKGRFIAIWRKGT